MRLDRMGATLLMGVAVAACASGGAPDQPHRSARRRRSPGLPRVAVEGVTVEGVSVDDIAVDSSTVDAALGGSITDSASAACTDDSNEDQTHRRRYELGIRVIHGNPFRAPG